MFSKYPEYFLQTLKWADYWKKSNLPDHEYFQTEVYTKIELGSLTGNTSVNQANLQIKLRSFVYKYPWHIRQNFLYIPKGPILEITLNGKIITLDEFLAGDCPENFKTKFDLELELLLRSLLEKYISIAKKHKSAFIKMDFSEELTNILDIKDNQKLLTELKNLLPKEHLRFSKKILQYLGTMTLDYKFYKSSSGSYLHPGDFSISGLTYFFEFSKNFWKTTNENIRRYTKKSLNQGWQLSIEKTQENFDDFWKIYQETSKRQNFFIHPKWTLEKLMDEDFSHLIIIRDEQNQPQCVWLGIVSEKTLTYLYGGNTKKSFEKYGQYLVHLAALKIVHEENLDFYDLGGYDETKGFGKFKEGYRGQIRKFLGPVDIILKPKTHTTISFLVKVIKMVRG